MPVTPASDSRQESPGSASLRKSGKEQSCPPTEKEANPGNPPSSTKTP